MLEHTLAAVRALTCHIQIMMTIGHMCILQMILHFLQMTFILIFLQAVFVQCVHLDNELVEIVFDSGADGSVLPPSFFQLEFQLRKVINRIMLMLSEIPLLSMTNV